MRRVIGTTVLAAMLFTLLALAPAAGGRTVRLADKEKRVVELVNEERAERGLPALRVSGSLTKAARAHSRAMATVPFFSHMSRNGRTPGQRMQAAGYGAAGYRSWRVGENIAWGSGVWATAEATVHNWMKSPPHRRIILTAAFRDIGIGTASGSFQNGELLLEDVTYFTLDVGRRSR
jgi:uncharacterized protein YkwD